MTLAESPVAELSPEPCLPTIEHGPAAAPAPRWTQVVPGVICLGLALCAGCLAPRLEPRIDLNAPGWQVKQGQAVWRPTKARPELAGELLAAAHPSGDSFVQFAKPPFQLVTARRSGGRWQITFGANDRTLSGRGTPPRRFIWFHLTSWIEAGEPPPADWRLERSASGRWRFENRSTGELLEGYFTP